MINIRKKLLYCVAGNAATLIAVIAIVFAVGSKNSYIRVGPSPDFHILDVNIDTWGKYAVLILFLCIINSAQIISEDIGMPILGFNIFNPDKKEITDFTKLELQVYGNTMYAISSVRSVFMTMVTIAQIDVAVISVLIKEIVSIYTIRMLLNEKTFISKPSTTEYDPVDNSVEMV